jgi:hypothetical protein
MNTSPHDQPCSSMPSTPQPCAHHVLWLWVFVLLEVSQQPFGVTRSITRGCVVRWSGEPIHAEIRFIGVTKLRSKKKCLQNFTIVSCHPTSRRILVMIPGLANDSEWATQWLWYQLQKQVWTLMICVSDKNILSLNSDYCDLHPSQRDKRGVGNATSAIIEIAGIRGFRIVCH